MNVPTPFNEPTRDDRFDRGLSRLLNGDPAGIEEIDTDLRDVTITMVSLANEAGWLDADHAPLPAHGRAAWWQGEHRVSNVIAAALLIGLVSMLIIGGLRVLNVADNQYGAVPVEDMGPGVCRRDALTDAEIARIVRPTEGIAPFTSGSTNSLDPQASLQLVRDWNACMQSMQWTRAMAYESDFFIWLLGLEVYPTGVPASATDAEIARTIANQHLLIAPISTVDGSNLNLYAIENVRQNNAQDDGSVQGFDLWAVPLDPNGDWIEWPTVVTLGWDGHDWVIVSSTQSGVPGSDYQRQDALPGTPVPAATAVAE